MDENDILAMRALIPDDAAIFGAAGDEYLFADAQLEQFHRIAGGSILRAAALACMSIASSEAMISKKIVTQDLQTDGAAVARALIEKADKLLGMAKDEEAGLIDASFDILDYGWSAMPPELTESEWRW